MNMRKPLFTCDRCKRGCYDKTYITLVFWFFDMKAKEIGLCRSCLEELERHYLTFLGESKDEKSNAELGSSG